MARAHWRTFVRGLTALGLAIGTAHAQRPPIEPGVKPKALPAEGGERGVRRDDLDAEWASLRNEVEALRRKVDAFDKKMAQPRPERQAIVVTTPLVQDLVVTRQYAGKIYGHRHISVSALVTGLVTEVLVQEGQAVKKDDVLFKTSSVLYRTKLDAELAGVRVAEIELAQAKKVADGKTASQLEVTLCEAKLAKAQAAAKLAEVELSFTNVRAPFDGIVGRMREQAGSLVKEGDHVTTLTNDSLLWVYFDLGERRYLEFKAAGKEIVSMPAELVLADGRKSPQAGKLAAIEPTEDGAGKFSISGRADFPNPDRLVRHGQTGTVVLREPLKNAVVIPQRATFEEGGKRYVYVVGKGDVVRRRVVDVRHEVADVFVTDGLEASDRIVLEGVRQLCDGDKVEYEFRRPEPVPTGTPGRTEK